MERRLNDLLRSVVNMPPPLVVVTHKNSVPNFQWRHIHSLSTFLQRRSVLPRHHADF